MVNFPEYYINFYKDTAGRDRIMEFLDSLQEKPRSKVVRAMILLKKDPWPPYPHSSHIKNRDFRELRVLHGGNYYRCFYRVYNKIVFVAHAIVKKSNKIDKNDIEIAHRRFIEYKKKIK